MAQIINEYADELREDFDRGTADVDPDYIREILAIKRAAHQVILGADYDTVKLITARCLRDVVPGTID